MDMLTRLVRTGSGLVLDLASTAVNTVYKRKGRSVKKQAQDHESCSIKPKYKRVWLWPS